MLNTATTRRSAEAILADVQALLREDDLARAATPPSPARKNRFDLAVERTSAATVIDLGDGRTADHRFSVADRVSVARETMQCEDDAAAKAEPNIHPIAAEMRDIILAKAVDGLPAMEEDFAHLTNAAVHAHFPAAKAAANRLVVRQLDDDRGFESRAQLLMLATALLMGTIPDVRDIHTTLRRHNLTNAEIAELWPDLIEASADAFKRSRATPLREVH